MSMVYIHSTILRVAHQLNVEPMVEALTSNGMYFTGVLRRDTYAEDMIVLDNTRPGVHPVIYLNPAHIVAITPIWKVEP